MARTGAYDPNNPPRGFTGLAKEAQDSDADSKLSPSDGGVSKTPELETPSSTPPPPPRSILTTTGGAALSSDEAEVISDDSESGRLLAEHMANAGYQPVVLFGNAASGKTSLLMSLLATIRTEAHLQSGLQLGEPIMDTSKIYGSYLWSEAQRFFGVRTQEFIEGRASASSKMELPFFIPLVFSPVGKLEIKIAFMESRSE